MAITQEEEYYFLTEGIYEQNIHKTKSLEIPGANEIGIYSFSLCLQKTSYG